MNPASGANEIEYFPSKLDIMINSFKAVNPNVKISLCHRQSQEAIKVQMKYIEI